MYCTYHSPDKRICTPAEKINPRCYIRRQNDVIIKITPCAVITMQGSHQVFFQKGRGGGDWHPSENGFALPEMAHD